MPVYNILRRCDDLNQISDGEEDSQAVNFAFCRKPIKK